MDAHLIDSAVFGHQWSTAESRGIFAESTRVARWLDVIIALAEAQADVGIIPASSAAAIAGLRGDELDLEAVAEGTRTTSHSTLGLIQVLQRMLPADAAEHVYYGTTVQDISDTAQVLEIAEVGELVWRDLWGIEAELLALAARYRETPMLGRTHGQPGAPITFGFKAATWADEIGRSLERLRQGRDRWLVAELGGAVGVLGFFGAQALPLRAAYCDRLGLAEPAISWLTTRDRLAEFAQVMAVAVGAMARIANEVYMLARAELAEVREPTPSTTVGSISMPHKRNPEVSEQIVTLARLVRSSAGVLAETLIGEHERDGRSWKTEWVVLPELSHYLLAASGMTRSLVGGLEVDPARMLANLEATGTASSERLLSVMSARLGKHRAQATLQDAYRAAIGSGRSLTAVLDGQIEPAELAELDRFDTGAAAAMADEVVARATRRRAGESASWR
ncbi:adenylosuccinate lyase family protein [Kribbella sp. NBC_00889]|uniref:class-II fumarase/aspartase family protein n=1 Tax=Kribbella sp. NBC_00889 TaxID=2975974 RepID=UPI00386D822D|nr:adenylosuccinate lyase family protein [Kribbella sp. NBC_00889]